MKWKKITSEQVGQTVLARYNMGQDGMLVGTIKEEPTSNTGYVCQNIVYGEIVDYIKCTHYMTLEEMYSIPAE